MMNTAPSSAAHEHSRLSDEALTMAVQRAAGSERQATARLVALLAEFDARRLYLAEARAIGAPPPVVTPLAPERYRIQFTVGRETHDRLRRTQDLLRDNLQPRCRAHNLYEAERTFGPREPTRAAATRGAGS